MDRATERAIEWDCTQLIHDFYLCLDEKRYADLLDLFAADGAWVRLGTELKGRTQIAEAMSERDHWVTAHVVSNVRVRVVDETSAHSTQYITLYRHEGSTAASGRSVSRARKRSGPSQARKKKAREVPTSTRWTRRSRPRA